MPKCKNCGNSYSFGSSAAPPAAPTANGPLSGIIGQFDQQSQMVSMNSWGVSKNMRWQAVANPQQFFDTCTKCGGQMIDWSDGRE